MIDLDIPYLDTHLNIALSLYIQRVNCTEQRYVETYVLQSIEKRLLVHLHVLAQSIDLQEAVPKDDADLFVYLSRRLLSPDRELQQQAHSLAKQILTEFTNSTGVIDAFILFYDQNIHNLLKQLYDSNKELRAIIVSVWHVRGQQIPLGLLNQSELQLQDSDLQNAVLSYHSVQQNVGLAIFKNYYRSLIENVKKEQLTSDIIHSSLWGGMLRRDKDIQIAIRRAIELESNDIAREKYLRLAALMGSNEFLPIFTSVCENKPEFGSYLLALNGTTESLKVLFSMLQKPQISVSIIPAWRILTGQNLKTVPRISVVDDKSSSNVVTDDNNEMPLIADVQSAQIWSKTYAANWLENTRYIHGEILDQQRLLSLSYQLSGQVGKDVIDLLLLQLKDFLNLNLKYWVSDRFEILDEISLSNG